MKTSYVDPIIPIKRALISVSDKAGLVELACELQRYGVEIVSTGGSAALLREKGIAVRDVADLTGFPEMMDGRVKTLHPGVHGGLLALREKEQHLEAMEQHGIEVIDLLIVNLYPFENTIAQYQGELDDKKYADCIENIDIGGPAMIRAAAKNHRHVTVVTDVGDYAPFLQELSHYGGTSYLFRQKMAYEAYSRTAAYDAAISGWFVKQFESKEPPRRRVFAGKLAQSLRYGENPHQQAAFYAEEGASLERNLTTARQWQGKELSYNNINDTDAAFALASSFDPADGPACVIVKHANPCGVARGATLQEAYQKAFICDQTSAFGGIVALNQPLDGATAHKISEIFTEVVIAPDASDEAKEIFAAKKNLRLLTTGGLADMASDAVVFKQVRGGFLVQSRDIGVLCADDVKIVTSRKPTDDEMQDMLFAWKVAKQVASNAIVYVKDLATVGIGAGQMSRIDSTRIASSKAEDMAKELGLPFPLTKGSVVASDAFFPFADGLLAAAQAGARAVIQPGGAMRDDEVIKAANEMGITMVFTNMRHFRH